MKETIDLKVMSAPVPDSPIPPNDVDAGRTPLQAHLVAAEKPKHDVQYVAVERRRWIIDLALICLIFLLVLLVFTFILLLGTDNAVSRRIDQRRDNPPPVVGCRPCDTESHDKPSSRCCEVDAKIPTSIDKVCSL